MRARLAAVRPSIDNAPPKTMGIKPRNLKKEQLLEGEKGTPKSCL